MQMLTLMSCSSVNNLKTKQKKKKRKRSPRCSASGIQMFNLWELASCWLHTCVWSFAKGDGGVDAGKKKKERMPSECNLQPGFDVFPGTKNEIAMGSWKKKSVQAFIFWSWKMMMMMTMATSTWPRKHFKRIRLADRIGFSLGSTSRHAFQFIWFTHPSFLSFH